jgi:hypothetical protein
LILIGILLPSHLLRDKIVAQGTIAVFASSVWAVAVHRSDKMFSSGSRGELLLWFILYLISIGVACALVHRCKRIKELLDSFAERLTVLSCLYVGVDFLSVTILIIRNIYENI